MTDKPNDLIDLKREQIAPWVRGELQSWLDAALATDPSPENAAHLYAGAFAAALTFSFQQFGGAANPPGFLAAVMAGAQSLIVELLETPPTRQ